MRVATLIFAALLGTGCGRYFAPDINLKRYVSEKEIVGTWSLVPSTLQLARRGGYLPAKDTPHDITFREDGTCRFRSIIEFGEKSEYLDAQGSWKLEHDTGVPGESKRKNEIEIRIGQRGISLYLTLENRRLLLWDYWGDPDSWEFLQYEKSLTN